MAFSANNNNKYVGLDKRKCIFFYEKHGIKNLCEDNGSQCQGANACDYFCSIDYVTPKANPAKLIDKLKRLVQKANENNNHLADELAKAQTRIRELNNENKAQAIEIERLKISKENCENLIASLKLTISKLDNEISDLMLTNKELNGKVEILGNDLLEERKKIYKLELINKDLDTQLKEKTELLERDIKVIKDLQDDIKVKKTRIEDLINENVRKNNNFSDEQKSDLQSILALNMQGVCNYISNTNEKFISSMNLNAREVDNSANNRICNLENICNMNYNNTIDVKKSIDELKKAIYNKREPNPFIYIVIFISGIIVGNFLFWR